MGGLFIYIANKKTMKKIKKMTVGFKQCEAFATVIFFCLV